MNFRLECERFYQRGAVCRADLTTPLRLLAVQPINTKCKLAHLQCSVDGILLFENIVEPILLSFHNLKFGQRTLPSNIYYKRVLSPLLLLFQANPDVSFLRA